MTGFLSAKPVERNEGLTSRVYSEIERMIVAGDIEPGSRLNEAVLAEQMLVSRGPVREATRALVKAGLLVSVPAKGVFVREMSDKEIAENYDVRAMLTGMICEQAAARRGDGDIAVLRRMIEEMDAAIEANEIARYYEVNVEFHDLIGHISGHSCAHRIYNDLIRETHSLRRSLSSPDFTNAEHRILVDAIEARDGDLSRQLGIDHVMHGKKRWKASLDRKGT